MVRKTVIYMCMSLIVSMTVSIAAVTPALAQNTSCGGNIITIKPWYHGLTDGSCNVRSPGSSPDEQRKFVTRVALNVVDGLIQVAAYTTVAFIIMGGFKYMTSAGSPDQATKARKSIINAVIGLVVAIGAVGLVNFIGAALGV